MAARLGAVDAVDTSRIDHYLRTLWEHKGSDLLLVAGAAPMVRIDGALRPIGGEEALTAERVESIVFAMLGPELTERLREERDRLLVRLGVASPFPGQRLLSARERCARAPPDPPADPDVRGARPARRGRRARERPAGLVLVTGPTGSGKSTTLASMIRFISDHRACHILTLEDPIEYHHEHSRSAVTQREIGTDSRSFARGLRSALREDPDVLLIGEMRDPESIQIALSIAETGHLVFATLHTNDAPQAIDRIIDVFPAESQGQIRIQLAATLVGVVAQRLVPRIGGGRVAAFEVLLPNTAVRNLIREGKTEQLRNVIATGQRVGMVTLDAALQDLVVRGLIAPESAAAVSGKAGQFGATPAAAG